MKKLFYLLMGTVGFLLALGACTDSMSDMPSGSLKQIVMTAPDFVPESGSRTNVNITNTGAEFSWATNDTVGIFPEEGAQVCFPMASGAGTKTATFNGGGWALKDGFTYAAYYPFIGKFYLDKEAIPIDYTEQEQDGNASTGHLGAYDYMAATPAAPEDGSVNFMFRHLGALAQLKFTIPEPTTIQSVTLSTEDDLFVVKGQVDIMDSNAEIQSTTTSNELTLQVKNVTTTENNQVVTFYMMIPPTDLSNQPLKATIHSNDGNSIEITLGNKNFEAGKAYALGNASSDIIDSENYNAVINENTTIIDATFASYVTNTVETTTIIMSTSTPADLLPEVGDIIVCGVEDEKFPYGFAGKVTEIRQEADGYVIETEQPELGEIFESINVEGEIPMEILPTTESRGTENKSEVSIQIYQDEDQFKGASFDFTLNEGYETNPDDNTTLSTGFQIHMYGDLGFKCSYKLRENIEGKEDCFDFNIDILKRMGMDLSAYFEGEKDFKHKIMKLPFKTMKLELPECIVKKKDDSRAAAAVVKIIMAAFQPELTLYYKTQASGKVSATMGSSNSEITHISIHDQQFDVTTNKSTNPETEFEKIELEGSMKSGLDFNFTMIPVWRWKGDHMVNLDFFIGPHITGEAEIGSGSENNLCLDIAPVDFTLSGEFVIYRVLSSAGETILNTKIEKSWKPWQQKRWLFPHYEDLYAIYSSENDQNIFASAVLKDTTIFPIKVGFALYDNEDKRIASSTLQEYLFPPKEGFSLQDEFTGINQELTYFVRPTVEFLDQTKDYDPKVRVEKEEDLRDALIKLYKSTNGDNWTRNDNWCSDLPIEEWYGVRYNPEGHYRINLGNNNLTGKIDQTFPKNTPIVLFVADNQLSEINLSGCTSLKVLICDNNQLTMLDVSGCTSLNEYDFDNNPLKTLDVSGCTSFRWLYCDGMQLKTLWANDCTSLGALDCSNNQLENLYISGCTSLTNLICNNNLFTSLDVSGFESLTSLECSDNPITLINASDCKSLEGIYLSKNKSNSLKIKGNFLERFSCIDSQLTSLDVSECKSLVLLDCSNNQLTSLDVSGLESLRTLYCPTNLIKSLNVIGCRSLKQLDCSLNSLQSLDLSGLESLAGLVCFTNPLTYINVSNCKSLKRLELIYLGSSSNSLKVEGNYLESIDYIDCTYTSLDVSNIKSLTSLSCANNNLKSLNLSGCILLKHLSCDNNQILREIPSWFSQLESFSHDVRYSYYRDEDNNERYIDKGVGWWYPGEPEKHRHYPD